ncbi:hypothetical protein O0L34_g14470 [Tuta absoluta]|nr:hypothetical protein O0L34_g14470 [Tuta absoluta]
MSEGDVSMIRDEDVLRRMWQQTEDFGKKKEIRAHMYRLREERLRSLYSPEPNHGKGMASATHVQSLLDQSFQSLKSKEVRDAGSPPKDFCRQDLKELSNAGWNVESENRTTDDGHTKIRAIHADIQGRYDVEGGQGKFEALDSRRQAHSEYQDGNTSVKKDEAASKTAHAEQVVRKIDDGTEFSSSAKTSSTSTSKFEKISTEVPYDESNAKFTQKTNTSDYEKTLRNSSFENGELISRKIDYPDDATKVIVETRCLPDGTRITSTRKEFRTPVQSTRSEQHSSKSESRYSNTSHRADSSSKITREYDIVDSQRKADDNDLKRNRFDYQHVDENLQTQQNISKTSDSKRFESRDSSSKIIRDTVDSHQEFVDNKRLDTRDSSSKITRESIERTQDVSDIKRSENVDVSSKIVRETVDRRQDISDVQKLEKNLQVHRDDVSSNIINQHSETIIDSNESKFVTDDKTNVHIDYSTTQRTEKYDSNVDKTDRRKTFTTKDNQNIQRDVNDTIRFKNNEERLHNIAKDQKTDEIFDNKAMTSDQYQTTYSNDYTQKKISNDWSPTHQAWASTLRNDTPSTTRPTTRASSPGSRTYQSSTSSLRSSVSPDKTCRKPSSRGGSPSKTDRAYSSDRYSSTTSTHTVTESKNYKHASPDRKPPVSPSRNSNSPDRKPDEYRQRPSQSPEKRSDLRPSSSPERRPYQSSYKPSERGYPHHSTSPVRSGISPDKKTSDHPKDIPFARPSASPERKPYKPTSSPDYPRTKSSAKDSPRTSLSPDRKPGYEPSSTKTSPGDRYPKESSPTRPSSSSDRKPSYIKPTAASKTPDTDRKSPTKHVLSFSPERKTYGKSTVKEEHYKFIDEETKMYTRTDRDDSTYTKRVSTSPDRYSGPRDRSPSPSRSLDDVPDCARADSPSLRSSLRKGRSPSPPKGPVTFTDDQTQKIKTASSDVTTKYDDYFTKTSKIYDSPTKEIPREPLPSKYGTYDKKRRSEETEEVTSFTSNKATTDVKYDSLTRREKTTKKTNSPLSPTKFPKNKCTDSPREPSPTKYGTYDKKRRTEEKELIISTKDTTDFKYDSLTSEQRNKDVPHSPTKKNLRGNVSPVKSPTKDTKYKHTTDFIATEKSTEEINKKTSVTDRSRKLVTPSTSPTRKPKTEDTTPSTGQSSPTTSVSGFVYFSSPKNETIVTDLDDEEYFSQINKTEEIKTMTHDRPKTLNVERSPSPSKIPCRSPSLDKKFTPTKDSLPRKSSLKKPLTDSINLSPDEKPPSSFRVSPIEDVPQHKIVKKDRPDKPVDSPIKPKAPFERRETYEERCLKILGVVDNGTETDTVTKKIRSSSVSPCRSPERETSAFISHTDKRDTNKVTVTDFIAKEVEDTIKKSTAYDCTTEKRDRNLRTPSRESSPAKLQDIISQKNVANDDEIDDTRKEYTSKITRESPNRDIGYQKPRSSVSPVKKLHQTPKVSTPIRPNQSPDRKYYEAGNLDSTRTTSPLRSFPSNTPTKSTPETPTEKYTKPKSPSRPSASPVRQPGFMRTTESTSNKYETSEDHETTIRRSIDREVGYRIKNDKSPQRPSTSPDREREKKPQDKTPKRSSVSPDHIPGYMMPTEATILKFEDSTTEKEICHHHTEEITKKPQDKTPMRSSISPDHIPGYMMPTEATILKFEDSSTEQELCHHHTEEIKKTPHDKTLMRSSASPDHIPGYMMPTEATILKFEDSSMEQEICHHHTEDITSTETVNKHSKIPEKPSLRPDSPTRKPAESKLPRTQSPSKKHTSTEDTTLLIQSERVLDRVQQSLRKLSPNREHRSPSRERSPGKTTISLQDIDVVTTETQKISTQTMKEEGRKTTKGSTVKTNVTRTVKPKDDKPKDQKPASKTPSRTVSPTKKPTSTDSMDKSRSISPKKPLSPTDRSQSPHVSKPSGIKPREPTPSSFVRKPSGNVSPTKMEKITIDVKKTTITKQNSASKIATKTITTRITSSTNKTEPEPKRAPTPKGNKENVSPKKDDIKMMRTASDTSLRNKKLTPQRMKSKPEIQVNDLSPTRVPKTSFLKKPTGRETPTKLAPKPKSATALNSTQDDDEIIIDMVEQAKSSRENSPDRICPTPVSFLEDVGTPRYPDEVREPDDDFRNRTHHTIHETESIVDDIVEISEDDELFVKKTEFDHISESDECLLSVTDKVSKFTNKIETVNKPKDSAAQFKDVERENHSDLIDENLKLDECLLSVSEKVNKFAKGHQGTRDKSPSRKIKDEFDTETVYQDDYTKLSVNDKAHLFIETAENSKAPKTKPSQKVERPDLSNVDDSLKSDECLLSVSDKVHKFVKTAEQFLQESIETEEKDRKVREQYEKFMQKLGQEDEDIQETKTTTQKATKTSEKKDQRVSEEITPSFAKETTTSHTKIREYPSSNLKPADKSPTVKITTLRSSEAVKKAKALFENIATTQQTKDTKTTKLLDIGVKKSPKTDSTTVLHPSVEDLPNEPESDTDGCPLSGTPTKGLSQPRFDKSRSPSRHTTQSPEVPRTKSPVRHHMQTTTKTVLSRYPAAQNDIPRKTRPEVEKFPKQTRPELENPQDKAPSFQRPTTNSQIKEEKTVEETEVSTRRGSGKFGVELRRTSVERSTVSSERRRSSTDHHQPCIEDIFDLDLLEQMLEKVVGYEQRRRIRAQIRVARKKETESDTTYTRHTKTTKTKSPERRLHTKSPERKTPQKTSHDYSSTVTQKSSTRIEHSQPKEQSKPLMNGHAKEPLEKRQRPQSPEKPRSIKTRSPVRQPSPEKKTRTVSPSKVSPKPKSSRFNEYASAYMKRVGLNETDKVKLFDKTKRTETEDLKTKQSKTVNKADTEHHVTNKKIEEHSSSETKSMSMSKSFSERTSSKETIEVVHVNGKRSPSPEKKRRIHSPSERLYQRSPSPDFKRKTDLNKRETVIKTVYETEPKVTKKETIIRTVVEERPKADTTKKETIIKTVYDIDKKVAPKQIQEEKPSWTINRNLKKVTSETRTFSNKKVEEKKVRPASPSKAIVRPIDAVVSSYGPGPLDADGKPLFGIKALRNGASNYQVKGTVIRQEYHSRNGSEPEGTVSVTAYSTEPEDLERLLQTQGEKPSRIHGLAAITTTKKFGGETGTSFKEAHSKEERAALDQFTHNERRVIEETNMRQERSEGRQERIEARQEKKVEDKSKERREKVEKREDKKTVRQSSVKSLTEKYIKSASDTSKSERTAYPKAGLILRTTNLKDSVSSDSSTHAGLGRTDSAHSLNSVEDNTVVTTRTTQQLNDGVRTTTTTTRQEVRGHEVKGQERSFLDSSTKVTGVQDILSRMRNADIVIEDGDTTEDSEARALLNKFLGATVLMAGMQNYIQEKPSGNISVRKETTRSSTAGGKTSTTSRRVEEVDLERCWDEPLLRKLLEESTDYEQRRRIRARIRNLMAEQEACASAVTEALAAGADQTTPDNDARGESLLLPLLQGLLGSGGEKLLAGLGAAGADVVADVRRSLARLRAALAPPANHPQANALLQLADRLEDALAAADRIDGCRRRPKRRSRANRHTVGVTQEELEQARRLVDRDQLAGDMPRESVSSGSTAVSTAASGEPTPERRPSIDPNEPKYEDAVSYHNPVSAQQKQPPVPQQANIEPTPVNHDAVTNQVVEKRAPGVKRNEFFRHSIADQPMTQSQTLAQPPSQGLPRMDRRPSEKSGIAAIANKFNAQIQKENANPSPRRFPKNAPIVQQKQVKKEDYRQIPLYVPLPPTYNFAAPPVEDSKPLPRFNNAKRNRMKRANTINIGGSLANYLDSDTDDDKKAPLVPPFRPQTENDRKFVAFMQKNEQQNGINGHANWSNRFGNIKHAFESRERDDIRDNSRSSSSSSARQVWRNPEPPITNHVPSAPRAPRRVLADVNTHNEVIKPPWANEKPAKPALRTQTQMIHPPMPTPPSPQKAAPPVFPSVPPQSPTKPVVVKPFAAKPIPVNQFSHNPMSAFKPPKKIMSPVAAPNSLVWSPPSVVANAVSPSTERPPGIPTSPRPVAASPTPPWAAATDKPRRTANLASRFEGDKLSTRGAPLPSPPRYSDIPNYSAQQNYPVRPIPSQNDLSAPELVKKLETVRPNYDPPPYKPPPQSPRPYESVNQNYNPQPMYQPPQQTYLPPQQTYQPPQQTYQPPQQNYRSPQPPYEPPPQKYEPPKIDAQKLQIEFYEKQIREKIRREAEKPTPPAYTITEYTPTTISTFVPLQHTPDIEKARAHKVDYLPDVVNETSNYEPATVLPRSPLQKPKEVPHAQQNGHGAEETTEHGCVETRVMRGPVRGVATTTAGVRTRYDDGRRPAAADSLRDVLDRVAPAPQPTRQHRPQPRRAQVPAPAVQTPPPAAPAISPAAPFPRSPLAASRDSLLSGESGASSGSIPLSKSGSWHQLAMAPAPAPKAPSPRRIVSRTKSMHMLAAPKLFEGGIAREELPEKKKTVEAYFSGQATSKSSSMRTKTSRSQSHSSGGFALGRSRTMPAVTELQFLDETNADDAFEDLVSGLA